MATILTLVVSVSHVWTTLKKVTVAREAWTCPCSNWKKIYSRFSPHCVMSEYIFIGTQCKPKCSPAGVVICHESNNSSRLWPKWNAMRCPIYGLETCNVDSNAITVSTHLGQPNQFTCDCYVRPLHRGLPSAGLLMHVGKLGGSI